MIGAIVTFEDSNSDPSASPFLIAQGTGSELVTWDVLGKSVFHRFLCNVETIAQETVVVDDSFAHTSGGSPLASTNARSFNSWEEAAQVLISKGAQTLLLAKLNNYIEVDLIDLLQFHRATTSKLTQVFWNNQALSLVLVQTSELQTKGTSIRRQLANIIPLRRRYQFKGYFNPLDDLNDFRQLGKDALSGRCHLRPEGDQIASGVWAAPDAFIHPSVMIRGSAYFGAHSVVNARCTVLGTLALEGDCEVDCGTSLEDCCITQGTYVGPGLNLRNAIAGSSWLYNVPHRTLVNINDGKLLGSTYAQNLWTRAKSFLSQIPPSGSRSTFFSQTASLNLPGKKAMAQERAFENHFKFESNRGNPSQ